MTTDPNSTESNRENPLLEDYLELQRDHADKQLQSALRSGMFRLAVKCDRCGTWLVATASVRRHLGPVCARRVQEGTAA